MHNIISETNGLEKVAWTMQFTCIGLRVSNSNCSEGQMRTYKVTQGPDYDLTTRGPNYEADATLAVPEPY